MTASTEGCCGGGAVEQKTRKDATGEEIKARVREVDAAAITADDKAEQSSCGCGCG